MSLMSRALKALCLCLVASVLVSCGGGGSGYGDNGSQPAPTGDPAWDNVAAAIAANCGGCHAPGNAKGLPVFSTGAAFKASKAQAKLTAGLMPPPPKTISSADKQTLLAYLGG